MLGFLMVLCLSVTGAAFPHRVFPELPGAVTLGDRGRTGVSIGLFDGVPALQLGRALDQRFDVWARVIPGAPFSLWARAVIVEDLGPLSVAVDLAADRLCLDAGLFLGPIRIDWGRSLAAVPRRWGILTVSPNPWLNLLLGAEFTPHAGALVAGVRLVPVGCGPVFSLILRDGGIIASVEAIL